MGRLFDFLKRYFHVITFVVLQVAALVMLSYSMNYPHYALARITKSITAPVNHLCFNVVRHFNLNSENEALVKQNLQLLQDQDDNFLIGDDSLRTAESVNVDTVRKVTRRTRLYDYSTASVVYNTSHKKNNYLLIDKGSDDGVTTEMAVLSPNGIVGVVTDVAKHFSTVTTLLNPSTKISAKVLRTNQLGTISWHFGDAEVAYLEDVPEHAEVNVGDSICTSGYSDIFPNNVLIGVVSSSEKDPSSGFLVLKVKLSTDFSHLNTVYLVQNVYRDEFEQLKSRMKDE